jgi:hypothetical protein
MKKIDNKKRAPRCSFCKKVKCKESCITLTGVEGKDFLKCSFCALKFKELTTHYKKEHFLEIIPNEKLSISFEQRSKAQKGRENWITKYKKTDLLLYEEKVSKMKDAVSKTILNNPNEKKRRSDLLKDLWKNELFREKAIKASSETASLTSKRPDIIQKRTEQLKKWRDQNPEKFFSNCVVKMTLKSTFKSKGEKILFSFLKNQYPQIDFKQNQFEKNDNFTTKTKWRQIDIKSNSLNLIIEFDGEIHFRHFNKNLLQKIQNKDKEFNFYLKEKYLIIRMSYDILNFKKTDIKKLYKEELCCLIEDQILEKKSGLIQIGKKYAKNN